MLEIALLIFAEQGGSWYAVCNLPGEHRSVPGQTRTSPIVEPPLPLNTLCVRETTIPMHLIILERSSIEGAISKCVVSMSVILVTFKFSLRQFQERRAFINTA